MAAVREADAGIGTREILVIRTCVVYKNGKLLQIITQEKQMDQVFVYGTLKCGKSNHWLLEGKYSAVRQAAVCGQLFDLGAYPVARFGGNRFIYGEVFQFDDIDLVLPALDRLEGVPTLYRRVRVPLFDSQTLKKDGTTAWSYEYCRVPESKLLLPKGVWAFAYNTLIGLLVYSVIL